MKPVKMSLPAYPVAAKLATTAPSAGRGGAKRATCVNRDVQSGIFFHFPFSILIPGTESLARGARLARVASDAQGCAPRVDSVEPNVERVLTCTRQCHGSGQGRGW